MKTLLINPPFEEEYSVGGSRSVKQVLNVIQPLGLAYLAAVLKKEGFPVKIIDCTIGISADELFKMATEENPDIVGITATTPGFEPAKNVARQIGQILPEAIIVVGGAHITAVPEDILSTDAFKIGVLGEGEETFLELVRHINGNKLKASQALRTSQAVKALEAIKGIVFKREGQLVYTGRRDFIQDLDSIPLPARELLPLLEKYHPTPASYRRLPYGVLVTSRGCPCRCTFCDRAIFGNTTRLRSADNVLDEIEELVHKYGAREVRFFDDLFTIDKNRVYDICEGLHKRKINIPWTCLTGVNFVTEDLLKTMRGAGCWQVLYGFESGDPEMLKQLKKGNTVEQNMQAIRLSRKAGLNVRGDFIVGTPGETLESMEKTVRFAIDMGLDYAHFNKFVPLPGTELYRRLIEQGYKFDFSRPCSILDHSALLYVPEGISKSDYRRFLDTAFKRFYLRPGYILKRLMSIRTWDEFKGQLNGFFTILEL